MMHLWRNYVLFIITLLITLNLQLDVTSSDDPHYVHHECPRIDFSYTSGSAFEANLTYALQTALPANASLTGFSSLTIGQGTGDQLNALYYCRGDIDGQDCHDCVEAAAKSLLQHCHLHKEGIAWFEECTLRYANRTILSLDEEFPAYRQYNFSGLYNILNQNQQIFDDTVDVLIHQAAYGTGKVRGFATREANLSSSKLILHGLAQCTPDILGGFCEKCLRSALKQRDGWSTPVIFLPSCSIRFDLYTSEMTGPPSPPPPPGFLVYTIVAVVVVVVILCVVIMIVVRCCRQPPGHRRIREFTHQELEVATLGFHHSRFLARGGFGPVYAGILSDGTQVAIKRLDFERSLQGDEEYRNELKIFKGFSVMHPNIVTLYGYYKHKKERMLVYELVPNKTLHHHLVLETEDGQILSWKRRMMVAISLAEAFEFLHGRDPAIIHRDIKPSNILMDFEFKPKVADFGVAKYIIDDETHLITKIKGSFGYIDPVYYANEELSKESDVYAFGIVLLQLITGRMSSFVPEQSNGESSLERIHIADWAEPKIRKAISYRSPQEYTRKFDALVDPKLNNAYNDDEVDRMVTCAAICVRPSRKERPSMAQVVQVLKGEPSPIAEKFKKYLIRLSEDKGMAVQEHTAIELGSQYNNINITPVPAKRLPPKRGKGGSVVRSLTPVNKERLFPFESGSQSSNEITPSRSQELHEFKIKVDSMGSKKKGKAVLEHEVPETSNVITGSCDSSEDFADCQDGLSLSIDPSKTTT